MIRTGDLNEITHTSPEHIAEFRKEYAQELGLTGLSASMSEEVTGYPVNVDAEGNHIITAEEVEVPTKELKPGDIGYSANKGGPQVLGQEK